MRVPPFRPGIGEIRVQAGNRTSRQRFQGLASIPPDDPGVRPFAPAEPVRGVQPVAAGPFHPDKEDIRADLGLGDQEGTLARADLHLERSVLPACFKQPAWVSRPLQLFQNEPVTGRIGVPAGADVATAHLTTCGGTRVSAEAGQSPGGGEAPG